MSCEKQRKQRRHKERTCTGPGELCDLMCVLLPLRHMSWCVGGMEEEEEEEDIAGRGSKPLLFMKDNSWSGISARTSLAKRAILSTWFPDLSM